MITIDIQVQPRASRNKLGPMVGDRLKVALTAPPVDGEANKALVDFLARTFGVSRGSVTIVRGHTGRKKTLRIEGVDRQQLEALLTSGRDLADQ